MVSFEFTFLFQIYQVHQRSKLPHTDGRHAHSVVGGPCVVRAAAEFEGQEERRSKTKEGTKAETEARTR
jgi:hypothetical protein